VIEARRAKVAKLYPAKSPDAIAFELDWSPATIDKDVAWLVEHGFVSRQPPGARRKYPKLGERECACGCGGRFTPASWEVDRRYFSIPCARRDATPLVRATARELLTEQHRLAAEEIARLNEVGYVTSSQFAAERKVTESTVSQWIARGLLKAERRNIEGEPHQLIRREEIDRFNAEEWPRILERMGRRYPANWGWLAKRRWTGRKVGPLGAQEPRYDDEQASLARRLKANYPELGRKRISRMVTEATGRPMTEKQARSALEKPLS
jgi:hypothetical protein